MYFEDRATGVAHALVMVVKEENQGQFQEFWLNNPKDQIALNQIGRIRNSAADGGDGGRRCGGQDEELSPDHVEFKISIRIS